MLVESFHVVNVHTFAIVWQGQYYLYIVFILLL